MGGAGEYPAVATLVYEFHLMLYTRCLTWDNSSDAIMAAGVAAVAALVLLAGRLPGHAKPGGDLRPPDAQVYGLVDQAASSASTFCCATRASLICSSTRVATVEDFPCARPGGGAGPRRAAVDGTRLALGTDWRFRRPMRSSVQPRYDSPGSHLGMKARGGTTLPGQRPVRSLEM